MRPQLLIRKIHTWAGLILSIQLLLWFFSGFMMSWMPINEIHGDHLLKAPQPQTANISQFDFSSLTSQIKQPVISIKIKPWLDKTVIEIQTKQQVHLFDATTLTQLSPINEQQVKEVIDFHIISDYSIDTIKNLNETPPEARGRKAPLWQVQLTGPENPRIYVSTTGEIVAKRTDRWRLFDFLWMLHIMDYDERDNFNHPLLYLTALSALMFTLSGLMLIFWAFKRPKSQ